MFKNHLKIAWRNLRKDKAFTLINVLGLSVAFTVAILLSMAGVFELSYDGFHDKTDDIYKVYAVQQTPDGSEASTSMPTPFAQSLRDEVPGITKSTRVLEDGALTIYGDKELSMDVLWVDADFFSIFSFPITKGNKSTTVEDLSSLVLSEKGAEKLFGKTDALGKTVQVVINGKEQPFAVVAIAANPPGNTSLDFEMAVRFENNPDYAATEDSWNSQYHSVYVQLDEQSSAASFEARTKDFINLHYEEVMANAKRDGASANESGTYREVKLLPLKDMRFTNYRKGYADTSRNVPYLILGVALLILFIACVNFINMSIAKSTQRLKEIGMRKTLGAKRKQLFFQFWGESLLVFLTASGIGAFLSFFLLDDFKSVFRTGVTIELVNNPVAIISFISAILLITLIVGGYPALVLSKIGTIQSLKGKLETNGKNRLRDALMVVQFGIAILMITGTLILREQIDFMRNKDLGYNKEQVISFPLNGKKNTYDALALIKQQLKGNPDITSVSASDNNLGRGKDGSQSSSAIGFEYKGKVVSTNFLVVDHDYVQTLDIQMAQGRPFRSAADSLGVLINEAMAKQLGGEDPLTAQLAINGDHLSPVLGVVKDYHFEDLDKAIKPLTFFMSRDLPLSYAYVKVADNNMASSFKAVANTWGQIEPNAEFLGSFLDENVDRTFRREKSMATMVTAGSIIAILLSCVGLFAMSMLIVLQRTKEIGIRKVIGASVASITYILTKDFIKLVLLAFLLASPIAWWFGRGWLQNYANRIDLSWSFFAISGCIALFIAVVTISTRTIKAAIANPVKSLRDE